MSSHDTPKIVRGLVVGDGRDPFPVDTQLEFTAVPVTAQDLPEGANWVRNWEHFEGALLAVGFRIGDSYHVHGSAIMVAPGVAFCAQHVVEPQLDGIQYSGVLPFLTGITSLGLQLWGVESITYQPESDLAILCLRLMSELPEDQNFRQALVTTRFPLIGESVLVFGFRAETDPVELSKHAEGADLHGNVLVSKGTVTNRFEDGRDKFFLPGSSFEVHAPTYGGMSGGPVYDLEGCLVGLLTSSIEEAGVSYVSHVWPGLTRSIRPVWPRGLFQKSLPLIELDERLCQIRGRDALYRIQDGDQWEYSPWPAAPLQGNAAGLPSTHP